MFETSAVYIYFYLRVKPCSYYIQANLAVGTSLLISNAKNFVKVYVCVDFEYSKSVEEHFDSLGISCNLIAT